MRERGKKEERDRGGINREEWEGRRDGEGGKSQRHRVREGTKGRRVRGIGMRRVGGGQ